jgi:PPOX class probable F420-dependent enzyme
MSHPNLDLIAASRYVRFTTYRADGTPVPTPTWVTRDGDKLYVYTQEPAGKVKRVRADAHVAIAPSDWRGKGVAPDVPATARVLGPVESAAAKARLKAKYKGEYKLFQVGGDLANKVKRKSNPPEVGIEITLQPEGADDRGRWRVSSGSSYEPLIKFSRAVRVGDTVHVAGTGPILPDGSAPTGAYEQAVRAFEIAVAALDELGATPAQVVRTRMYLTSADDWKDVARAHGEAFADAMPAATLVVVKELLDPAWKIEVEVEAIVR